MVMVPVMGNTPIILRKVLSNRLNTYFVYSVCITKQAIQKYISYML